MLVTQLRPWQHLKTQEKCPFLDRFSAVYKLLKCPRLLYQSYCEFSVELIGPLFLYQVES